MDKELKEALTGIEKKYGIFVKQIKDMAPLDIESIPTGSLSLDVALGVGGFPRGRIIEIFGPESGGKSLISLKAIAEVQKRGGKAVFVDAEYAFNPKWAGKLGVDVKNLYIVQPDYAEKALNIVNDLVETKAFDIIVIDSVTALVPKSEFEEDMEKKTMGAQAGILSQALRKLVGKIAKSQTIVIFINQLREKVGVMFGNPETTPGGRALKFYSSIRIRVSKIGPCILGEDKEVIGHKVHIKIEKNKVAPPFREAEFTLLYGSGISDIEDLINVSLTLGVIIQSGPSYVFGEQKWFGREKLTTQVKGDEKLREALITSVRGKGDNK